MPGSGSSVIVFWTAGFLKRKAKVQCDRNINDCTPDCSNELSDTLLKNTESSDDSTDSRINDNEESIKVINKNEENMVDDLKLSLVSASTSTDNADIEFPSDPFLFKDTILNPEKIREMISIGACQPGLNDNFNFPVDSHNRRFKPNWYKSEGKLRNWLIYSPRANCLFCFSCWLYASLNLTVWSDPNQGFKNFKKGPEKIKQHEESQLHRSLHNKFLITKLRLYTTIIQEQWNFEKKRKLKEIEMP
ncbi:uncharacterized protein LOC115878598 [Sitophilus oryzae]|uniref:Uncharacterized protein LOC115878598 n=1 Tax=Sitophilus oryzae TaxID=7048 RepID=A0A6J2XI80_SITOR|nr:uncharacterized protein LOC115878598 [Sitophilus oryzae]